MRAIALCGRSDSAVAAPETARLESSAKDGMEKRSPGRGGKDTEQSAVRPEVLVTALRSVSRESRGAVPSAAPPQLGRACAPSELVRRCPRSRPEAAGHTAAPWPVRRDGGVASEVVRTWAYVPTQLAADDEPSLPSGVLSGMRVVAGSGGWKSERPTGCTTRAKGAPCWAEGVPPSAAAPASSLGARAPSDCVRLWPRPPAPSAEPRTARPPTAAEPAAEHALDWSVSCTASAGGRGAVLGVASEPRPRGGMRDAVAGGASGGDERSPMMAPREEEGAERGRDASALGNALGMALGTALSIALGTALEEPALEEPIDDAPAERLEQLEWRRLLVVR